MSEWRTPDALRGQLRELYGLECPPRWGMPRDLSRKTLGPKLSEVMARLGTPPMPWQRYVNDVALEIDPVTNGFAYRYVGLSVMRQQGKTTISYGAMIHRAMAFSRSNIIYTAQDRNYARARLEEEIYPAIMASPYARFWKSRMTNGSEQLIYQPGFSRIHIAANTESSGHGPPLDMGMMDEVFAHKDDRLQQAFAPAMLTREQYGQLWWGSNAGDERSTYLNDRRESGRRLVEAWWNGHTKKIRTAYFEWYPQADEHDRTDRSMWLECMPGMCPEPPCRCDPRGVWRHTCTAETVAAELDSMSEDPAAFDRAYLNITRKAVPPSDPNIPRAEWIKSIDPASVISGSMSFGIEVSPDREWSSIGVAGMRVDGKMHLELVARRAGVEWLIPGIVRLKELWDPACIVVDERSPAGAVLLQLERAGVATPRRPEYPRRGDLLVLRTVEAVRACGQWVDLVRSDGVRHRDQVELTAAVNSAVTRTVGDAWMFGRRVSGSDIAPLMACVNAAYGHGVRAGMVDDTGYDLAASVG